jgi:hypothetical protein
LGFKGEFDSSAGRRRSLKGDFEHGYQIGQWKRATIADLLVVNLDSQEEILVGIAVIVVCGEAESVKGVGNQVGERLRDDTKTRSDSAVSDSLGPPMPSKASRV